jgi:hypothetical protein
MKKFLFFLTLSFVIGNIANAQTCKCNPNGFNPFVYNYAGESQTVRAGHQFSVKCNTPVKLDGGYKCSYTTPCEVKLKAVLKNAAGVVIRTYANFSFPFEHSFEAAGNYVLEIAPWCNGKKCPTAKFYFTVSCDTPTACACNDTNGWDRFTAYIDGAAKPTVCGSTFTLKKEQPITIKGGYKCVGNCDVIINGTLTNATTGTVTNYPNMKFEGEFKFPVAGDYKLVAVPTCNGKECKPCIFYFKVN